MESPIVDSIFSFEESGPLPNYQGNVLLVKDVATSIEYAYIATHAQARRR